MEEEVIELVGEKRGTTSVILAGVHGDETCGLEAFKKLLPELEIEAGRVFFIYANPLAIKAGKRFIEANLNRMLKNENLITTKEKNSYEYNRAKFLKIYLNQAEALLDIHSSSNNQAGVF